MAVAFDAFSNHATGGTGDLSWTHTPVGTPRGIIVLVCHVDSAANDKVTGVTYGGVAMSEMSGSPNTALVLVTSGIAGAVHAFFLGSSIPTGAQTVAVTTSSAVSIGGQAAAISLTASSDTEVVDSDGSIEASVTNPSVTLSLSGRDCFCVIAAATGQGAVAFVSPLSGWTSRHEIDFGLYTGVFYTYNTIGSTDVTAGYTLNNAKDSFAFCCAVSEAAAVATAYTFTGPSSGTVNVASTNFTVTPNGTSTATVTPATDGSGSFTPATVQFDGTAAAKTFTYTPTDVAGSPHTLSTSDDGGLTETSGTIDYTVNAGGSLPPRRRTTRFFKVRG